MPACPFEKGEGAMPGDPACVCWSCKSYLDVGWLAADQSGQTSVLIVHCKAEEEKDNKSSTFGILATSLLCWCKPQPQLLANEVEAQHSHWGRKHGTAHAIEEYLARYNATLHMSVEFSRVSNHQAKRHCEALLGIGQVKVLFSVWVTCSDCCRM